MERPRTDQVPAHAEVVDQKTAEAGVLVRVSGELDLANVGDLEERVERAMAGSPGPLLIDFTDCAFIDSSVISLLLKLHRSLGGSIPPRFGVVARSQPRQVLGLTGLDREIAVFGSLGEALGTLQIGDGAARRPLAGAGEAQHQPGALAPTLDLDAIGQRSDHR